MDTKALRQKILDLAIRGKLVPQNPEDEPASVLLERIRLEKRQMVKDGKLKAKDIKNDSVIFVGEDSLHYEKFADGTVKCIEDEIPFEVPEGWALLRLQTFIKFVGGNQPPKSTFENIQTKDNIRLIQIRDYKSDKYITFIPRSKAKRFCTKEDVMIGRYGPPIFQILRGLEGAYNVALMKAIVNQDIMSNDYMYYMLQDGELLQRLESKSARTCGQDGINMYELNQYIVGIPPNKKKKRIINFLTESLPIVNKISNSQDELSKLIQETKKKVLNLAIRGKLVPQKPDDEPASVLLEHIRDKKEHLIKEGKIKRDKKESTIFKSEDNSYYEKFADGTIKCIDEEIPFEIPDTWTWSNLQELCNYGECDSIPAEKIPRDAWILDLEDIEKQSGKILQRLTATERQSTSTKHSFRKNMVLYSKLRPYLNKVVLADSDGYCTTEILPLDFIDIIYPRYAQFFLMSPFFVNYAKHCSYGMKMPRLGTKDGKNAYFAIPPYNEQIRIANNIEKIFNTLSNIENAIK